MFSLWNITVNCIVIASFSCNFWKIFEIWAKLLSQIIKMYQNVEIHVRFSEIQIINLVIVKSSNAELLTFSELGERVWGKFSKNFPESVTSRRSAFKKTFAKNRKLMFLWSFARLARRRRKILTFFAFLSRFPYVLRVFWQDFHQNYFKMPLPEPKIFPRILKKHILF